jgi:hypothetical protein
MIEPPHAPDSWSKKYTDSTKNGWVTSYDCTRNGQLAHMEVFWRESSHNKVDIRVYEFPSTELEYERSEKVIELTVPVTEAKQKIDEAAEAWIKTIENS